MLVDRLPFINEGAMLECVLSAYFVLVRIAAFRKNFDRAHTLLERAENLGTLRNWGRLCAGVALERVWLYLRDDRIGEAVAAHGRLVSLADRFQPSIDFAWHDVQRYAVLGRAYVASAQRHFDDALATLENLKNEVESARSQYFALRVAAHLCVVRFHAGQTTAALGALRRVLNVAARAGIRQLILDEGPRMGALLTAFQETVDGSSKSGGVVTYVSGLVAALSSDAKPGNNPKLMDALSVREGAILQLIAQGFSNKEIARNLAIAPETVKTHVKRIFIKLDSEKRAQAVARAQSLGLVSTR
jgi:LuxR family maltose regulon positive regulatory protein